MSEILQGRTRIERRRYTAAVSLDRAEAVPVSRAWRHPPVVSMAYEQTSPRRAVQALRGSTV